MIRRLGPGMLGALLLVLLSCAAPAGAATGFVTDETLSSAVASSPAVAMAPNGYAIVGWVERTSGVPVVHASTRSPGGTWSPPATFPVSLDSVFTVSVAIAASGAAAVTWEEVTSPTTFAVGVASRAAGGAFAASEVLSGVRQTLDPSVGIAADGTVTLLYAVNPDTVLRDFPAGGSALAAPVQPLAASCSPGFNSSGIAEAPSGDAVAPLYCGGASFALRRGGRWAVSPTVANSNPGGSCPSTTSYNAVSATIDAAGEPVGLLQRTFTQRFDLGIGGCQTFATTIDVSLVLPLGGFMTAVPGPPAATGTTFSFFGFPLEAPRAAISPAGIVFAWADTPQLGRAQQMVRFYGTDGSGGSAPQPVGAESAGVGAAALAVAADGRALLAWTQLDRPGGAIGLLVAERPPGGAFGIPVPIQSADAASAALAMADDGDGLAVWTVGATAPYAMHVRGYDAAPPTLGGATIPASASVGAPAAFAASPFDMWGPLTTSWSFGDGATATGASVTHAYARTGSFTATVTATDAVGNAVSQSGTVQVTGGAGVAPGEPPVLTAASLTNRRFRVGRSRTVVSAGRRARRAPVGTTFRFRLDRAASVRIAFARRAGGLRGRGGRCVRPSRRLRRAGARRCTRLVAIRPALTRSLPAGGNAVPFSGRIGRRALAPGRYVATLTPTSQGVAGTPSRLRFRVVPR
jgi:PKD domain